MPTEQPATVSPTPARHTAASALRRIMFLGDSITEGCMPARKFQQLNEGLCSFREVLVPMLRERHPDVIPVGPFKGSLGMAQTMAPHCNLSAGLSNHAASWGVSLRRMVKGERAVLQLRRTMRFAAFGNKFPRAVVDQATRGVPVPPAIANEGLAARWIRAFAPDLVVVLLGANDVWASAAVALQRLNLFMMDIQPPPLRQAGSVSTKAQMCVAKIAVSTLVPRNDTAVNAAATLEFNERLLALCDDPERAAAFAALCSDPACVKIIDGGGVSEIVADVQRYTIDTVHPNEAGERLIARRIFDELTRVGLI